MEVEGLLKSVFGFESFKLGQKQVIEKVLAKKSAAAIFPTGSGKSLCYQIPATQLNGITLVVSPLLSLMKDQLDFLHKHKIKAARLDHSLERSEYNQVLLQAKNKQLKILMISVERFKNERFRAQLKQMDIALLVIDEAHCISEWGHNFRPDYLKLPQYQKEFNIPQSLLLTATATPKVIADMRDKFEIDKDDVVVTGFYRKNLILQMSPTLSTDRHHQLLNRIKQDSNAPTIVYVTLQKTAESVAAYLVENNINAQHYHAGMKPDAREMIQNRFMQGELNCIVATIAFGMGIDKKDVRRVLHFDLPKSIENYSQEIGRAGRDDQQSICEIFANNDSLQVQENFVYGDTPEQASIRQLLKQIQQTAETFWETKLLSLSNELNIRILPLKTLLVYLELAGVIKPKFTYFEEYSFKNINNTDQLINRFDGERRSFIAALFDNCVVKKTWTYVDVEAILAHYNTDRARIMTALEWFDDQGLIDLQAKQAVERFDIIDRSFDRGELTNQLHQLFINKEHAEIDRIHAMLAMFESDRCISIQLAAYFGETLQTETCGHCSVCLSGPVSFKTDQQNRLLETYDFVEISESFIQKIGVEYTVSNLTKFLCGIHTPVFTCLKIRALPHFAVLENQPFEVVKKWVESQSI